MPNTNSSITVKGLLLGGTCDLPAKAMMMNMMQYNGRFGCSRCKQEGTVVATGNGHGLSFRKKILMTPREHTPKLFKMQQWHIIPRLQLMVLKAHHDLCIEVQTLFEGLQYIIGPYLSI